MALTTKKPKKKKMASIQSEAKKHGLKKSMKEKLRTLRKNLLMKANQMSMKRGKMKKKEKKGEYDSKGPW